MKPKVYLETTFISYLTSRPSRDLITAGHQQISHEWWDNKQADFDLYTSPLVIQESMSGDAQASERRLAILKNMAVLEISDKAVDLAQILISARAVPEKAGADALHIAVTAVHEMDYLLTWNMAHLANASMRTAIMEACIYAGYKSPVICTPEELLEGDTGDVER
jgi:predicted nucleic acid-binding protein